MTALKSAESLVDIRSNSVWSVHVLLGILGQAGRSLEDKAGKAKLWGGEKAAHIGLDLLGQGVLLCNLKGSRGVHDTNSYTTGH